MLDLYTEKNKNVNLRIIMDNYSFVQRFCLRQTARGREELSSGHFKKFQKFNSTVQGLPFLTHPLLIFV